MSDEGSSDESHDSGSEAEVDPAQWNVNSRQRRTTAGNRLSTLLHQESTKDDEVELLFEENEEEPDEDFDVPAEAEGSDAEAANDEEGGGSSSSSDEDGGEGDDDDLAGEKQLEKEERQAKRSAKRKADAALVKPRPSKPKRVKIAEPAAIDVPKTRRQVGTPATRPRKKPDRVSWILNKGDSGPVRTSSRTLSMQNKEKTQASLKEAETKRIKQMAVMEAAQKRKDASKTRPMNQAERMAEAARTERKNAKSLNRWEEMERDRVAKQKAKQYALQNRQLEGPVIRWWSGRAEWLDGKLMQVGRRPKIEEVVEPVKKTLPDVPTYERTDPLSQPMQGVVGTSNELTVQHGEVPTAEQVAPLGSTQPMEIEGSIMTDAPLHQRQPPLPQQQLQTQTQHTSPSQQPSSFLDGIDFYAAHPEDSQPPPTVPADPPREPAIMTEHLQADVQSGAINATSSAAPSGTPTVNPSLTDSTNTNLTNATPTVANPPMSAPQPPQSTASTLHPPPTSLPPFPHASTLGLPPPPISKPPPLTEYSTRTTLTLLNYPTHITLPTPSSLDLRRRILFNWPSSYSQKPTKPAPVLCAATGQTAKYWDPELGVGYRDLAAGKRLRGLVGDGVGGGNGDKGSEGRPVWSQVLGAWVSGQKGVVGVPRGFDGGVEDVVEAGDGDAVKRDVKSEGESKAAVEA